MQWVGWASGAPNSAFCKGLAGARWPALAACLNARRRPRGAASVRLDERGCPLTHAALLGRTRCVGKGWCDWVLRTAERVAAGCGWRQEWRATHPACGQPLCTEHGSILLPCSIQALPEKEADSSACSCGADNTRRYLPLAVVEGEARWVFKCRVELLDRKSVSAGVVQQISCAAPVSWPRRHARGDGWLR